jgi:tRNA A-37 threonylcarbamoyl transferase component Bud32
MPGGQSTGGELFAKGKRVDRYEIREAIGQGGMGAVYRAFDTKLGRMVALKTVVAHRRGAMSEELRQRFMREALAASKVDHRNVVRVLDFGFTEDGSPFIVMEYLRGQDLGARLRQNAGPLPVELVIDVMLGVCAALRACHQAGIIHRDLKPANIFLADADTGYEVKVLDFGVSKAPLAGDLTEDGQILGTPQYLSPEQVEGRTVPESDQYALGMLLYACLTNRLPYEQHQNISLLRAIELGKFDPPRAHRPDLPPALEAIILQALRVSPGERFPSVHALGQRLWEFASPTGRDQWRAYYFQPAPAKPKESTVGVGVLEELARGTLKGPGPGPVPALAPTEALAHVEPAARAVTPAGARPGPQALISTKLSRPETPAPGAGPGAAEGSLIDVAGESAIRQYIGGGGRTARRALLLLVGGGAVVAAVFIGRARMEHAAPRRDAQPSMAAPAALVRPMPSSTAEPAIPQPEPAAATAPPPPSPEDRPRPAPPGETGALPAKAAAKDAHAAPAQASAQGPRPLKPSSTKGPSKKDRAARRTGTASESSRSTPDDVPIMP